MFWHDSFLNLDEDSHMLTVSFELEEGVHNWSHFKSFHEMAPLTPIHIQHNSNSSLRSPLDSPIPFLNTSQILPLKKNPIPPSPHSNIFHPSLSVGPLISCNFPPLPRIAPSLSLVPLFSGWPKIYDNKTPDAAESEGWPRGDPPFFSSASVPLFTHTTDNWGTQRLPGTS